MSVILGERLKTKVKQVRMTLKESEQLYDQYRSMRKRYESMSTQKPPEYLIGYDRPVGTFIMLTKSYMQSTIVPVMDSTVLDIVYTKHTRKEATKLDAIQFVHKTCNKSLKNHQVTKIA